MVQTKSNIAARISNRATTISQSRLQPRKHHLCTPSYLMLSGAGVSCGVGGVVCGGSSLLVRSRLGAVGGACAYGRRCGRRETRMAAAVQLCALRVALKFTLPTDRPPATFERADATTNTRCTREDTIDSSKDSNSTVAGTSSTLVAHATNHRRALPLSRSSQILFARRRTSRASQSTLHPRRHRPSRHGRSRYLRRNQVETGAG